MLIGTGAWQRCCTMQNNSAHEYMTLATLLGLHSTPCCSCFMMCRATPSYSAACLWPARAHVHTKVVAACGRVSRSLNHLLASFCICFPGDR